MPRTWQLKVDGGSGDEPHDEGRHMLIKGGRVEWVHGWRMQLGKGGSFLAWEEYLLG